MTNVSCLTRLGWRTKREGHLAVSSILKFHVDGYPAPDSGWFRLIGMVGRCGQNIQASLYNELYTY